MCKNTTSFSVTNFVHINPLTKNVKSNEGIHKGPSPLLLQMSYRTVYIFYSEWPENFIMESNGPDMIVCSLGEVLGHFISLHKITFLALIIFAVGKSKIFLNVDCFLLYIEK